MKKLTTIPLAMLFACTLTAHAEDREWIPYKKFVESVYVDKFYSAPATARDKLNMTVKVVPVNPAFKSSDVVLTIPHAGGKERLEVAADGSVDLVPNTDWLKENPMMLTSMPKGEKVSISVAMNPKMPDGLQFSYATLMGSVQQANDLVKAYAGVLRFMMPKNTSVVIKFAKPAQQTVRILTKDGTKSFSANAKGEIELKPDDALMKENPVIALSERPTEAMLGTN